MRYSTVLLLSVAFTTPALGDPVDEVRCREIGFSKSVEIQDHDRFASFIDPDARFVGSKVDRSREAIAEAWTVFFTGDLPSIKAPCLWLCGAEDGVVPAAASRYGAGRMPRGQAVTIAGAGHAPFLSHTQESLSRVLSFLAEGQSS